MTAMDSRMQILIFLLALLCKGGLATTGCWDETTAAPMFLTSPGGYLPEDLTATLCKDYCSVFGFKHSATAGGKFCLCTELETLTGQAGTTCDIDCEGEATEKCGGISDYSVEEAKSAITGFDPTATPASKSPDVTFASVSSSVAAAKYVVSLNDGSPLVELADNDVIKINMPGVHHVTVHAGVDPANPFGASKNLEITIEQEPEDAKINCPAVVLPETTFYCNFSLVSGTGIEAKVAYTDKAAAVTERTLGLPDPLVMGIGTPPPHGTISDFETLETFDDTLDTDTITLADMFPDDMYVTAIEYHINGTAAFDVTIQEPTCASPQEYCATDKGYCADEGKCSQIYRKAYECSDAEHFCGLRGTCQESTCADRSTAPTYQDLTGFPITITPTGPGFGVEPVAKVEVPKGSIIVITGSTLTYRKAFTGETPDLTNDLDSGKRYYIQVVAVELSRTDVDHTCIDEDEVTASIKALTGIAPLPASIGSVDATIYCQYPIEGLEATVSKVFIPTNEAVTFTVTITKGSVVKLTFDYGDGNPEEEVAAPVTFPHDQAKTFTDAGNYTVIINATNEWSTEMNYGINTTEIEVVVLNKVTTDWEVVYPASTHKFALDTTIGSVDVDIELQCTACAGDPTLYPTLASGLVNWGDGNEEVKDFPATYAAVTITHPYNAQGFYNITVNISNLVNFEMFEPTDTPVEIHEKIENLGATLGYFSPYQPGVFNEAMGKEKDQLPLDFNVTIQPTLDAGSVKEYILTIKENGTEIGRIAVPDSFKSTGPEIQMHHHFPEEGLFNVTLKAVSPVDPQYDVEVAITFKVIGDVKGITIDDEGVTKPGENKTFEISFISIGSGTCMLVDFGNGKIRTFGVEETCNDKPEYRYDGTHKELFSPFKVTSIYYEEKTFNITVFAWNNRPSQAERELMFAVSGIDCNRPEVTIVDAAPLPTFIVKKFYKSEQHVLATEATIDCEALQSTKKRWEIITIINATTLERGEPMPVMKNVPTWDKSQIVIPPRFLHYGIYEAQYSLTMWGDNLPIDITFQSIARTYIEIIPTPLVAILIEGGPAKLTRGADQIVALDPDKFSYDPDDPPLSDKSAIKYKWFCTKVDETLTGSEDMKNVPESPDYDRSSRTDEGCFGEGPGPIKIEGGHWELKAGLMFKASNTDKPSYRITVEISKDIRTATASIVLTVVEDSVPEIQVGCLGNLCRPPVTEGIYFNPDQRLALEAKCVVGGCLDSETEFDWEVQQCLEGKDSVDIDGVNDYLTVAGPNNNVITISVDLFSNKTDIMCYELTTTAKVASSPLDGEVKTKLMLNQPPAGGTCKLLSASSGEEVTQGVSGVDSFEVDCPGWKDPEDKGIQYYKAFYKKPDPAGGNPMRQDLFTNPAVPVSNLPLPPGTYKIIVEVTDVWGGISKPAFELPEVTITMPSLDQLKAQFDPKSLGSIAGSGDVTQLTALSQATFALLNEMPEFQLEGKSAEEQENIQLESAQIKKNLLGAMHAQMSMESEAQRDMALSAVVSAVSGLEADGPAGKIMGSIGRQYAVELLDDIVTNFVESAPGSPQKMQETFRSVAAASAGVFNNIVSVAKDKNCSAAAPPADVEDAEEKDYEPGTSEGKVAAPKDPLEAIQCYAKDSTIADAKEQVEALLNGFEKIAIRAIQTSVLGEELRIATPNGASEIITKNYPGNISTFDFGKSGAKLHLPKNFMPANLNSEPVAVASGNMKVVPQVYAENAELISRESQSLKCSVYSTREDNKKLKISGLEDDPIRIYIPINPMDLPEPEVIECTVDEAFYTCYSEILVEFNESVILIQFRKQDANAKFVVMLDHEHMPVPVKDEEGLSYIKAFQIFDNSDTAYMEENQITYNESSEIYTMMFRTNLSGRYFMGVLEVDENCTNWETCIEGKNDDTFDQVVKSNMTSNYAILIFSTGCYYYDKPFNRFATDGLKLESVDSNMVVCRSTHLSTFGSGFFVMPNTIDFNYVFANAGFTDNLTIYLTIIFTLAVYIILLIWACLADRKDLEKLGATPMPDNRKEDKYLYEVMVFTGHATDASTDSNVSFMVKGDKGETPARHFGDSERPIFRKGECDVFVLATPRPLGNLNYIRIWHDNTGQGGFASWFLSFIVFKDVQTGHKYEFIANTWFAVDEDDGQIDRLITVAGLEQKSDFNHLFTTTSQKNLSDGHLWFSVFLRPPRSRFTRCQRVSCCMALLYLSMLVNAMWYERTPDKPSGGINFGPFALSVEQIGIGVMANLIVFPPSFLIVWLFRTSRPRKLRQNRIDKALEKQGRGKEASKGWAESGGADPKEGSQVELVKSEKPEDDNKEKDKKKKKKKFTLPWFFVIVAWFLCVVCLVVSVFFLWAYGITFGNEKTTQWVTSLIVSFFSSVLFVQPLKVFILAMLFSLICKAVDQDSDDADEDEVEPTLASDEEWIHAQPMPRQKMSAFCPLSEAAKKEAKDKRMKEKKMMSVLWEMTFYFTYLTILLVLCYGNRDPNAFLLKTTLQNSFIKLGDRDYDYSKVNTASKWWNWALKVIPEETRPQRFYNDQNPYGLKMFLNDYYNRLMGHGIIRQARVKPHSCKVVKEARNMTTDCAGAPKLIDEDHEDYCRAWAKHGDRENCSKELYSQYKYTSSSELESYPEVKILDMYGGGGYVIRMKGSMSDVRKQMVESMHQGWVDELTRALFVEFYVYNAQVNLFGLASITAEFVPGGGIHPSWRFDGIRLLQYHQGFGLFVIICEVCFVIYTVFFTFRAIKELRKEKKAWFKDYWNWGELFIIIISYAAMVVFIIRMITANDITKTFKDTWGNGYIRLQHVYYIDELFGYMISFIVFISSLKLIKLLRFNKRMGILSATLRQCWDDLTGFLFVFFLSFLAFVQMFYLFLFKNMYDFHNILTALESCFSMMLGKFSFEEMKNTSMFAAGMFFVFAIVMSVILINLFITIILRSFEQIKHDILSQPSEYEIVSFMITRIKAFMGVRSMGSSQITPANSAGARREIKTREMNAKVDKMLAYINGIYFDGDMDPNSKESMKSMYLSKKKGQ